ncbi:MAG: DEAD/DEAH box helicase [Pseudomonadota bacterium]
MTDFTDFGLAEPIQRALTDAGYTTPTPIQTQAIGPLLDGRDVLGIAQTGTGKTLAFAAPTLHRLKTDPKPLVPKCPRVLVLAPTRELARQIADSFETYGKHMRVKIDCVFGGMKINRQIRSLSRGSDVLVATPGRLLDLIDQKALDIGQIETLILDEADQMLDLGFIHALRKIRGLVPQERQTLFFSATMPKVIASLSKEYLTDPVRLSVTPVASTAERVDQSVIFVHQKAKPALLAHVLKQDDVRRVLVFTRTKYGADRLVRQLDKVDIEAAAIHGNKSQNQRTRALDAFKNGKIWVLIATDIAARGIDIDGLTHVVNFDLPNIPEQYVHRIGRTGRAGASGVTIGFVAPDERAYLKDIEKTIRMAIPVIDPPEGFEMPAPIDTAPVGQERPPRRQQGGNGGRRRGKGGGGRPQGRRKPEGQGQDKRDGERHRKGDAKPAKASGDGSRKHHRRRRGPKPAVRTG